MAELTRTQGYEWCEEIGGHVSVWLPDGPTEINLRAWYSKTVPHLEVVQAIPGTVWSPAAGSGIHHLGYWVEDVAYSLALLEAEGYVREAAGVRPDGQPYWAYLRHPEGIRVELVSQALQPTMERYFENGTVGA